MQVIKPTDGRAAAERRLAARMLCIEHAAVAYTPDLSPIPPPHAPCPLIEIPPITAKGLPSTVHYRATVGIVFYTTGKGFQAGDLVRRVSAILGALPDAHLLTPRAIGSSLSAVVRRRGQVVSGHAIVGPRKCYKKSKKGASDLPARLLMWTPLVEPELPQHYSIRASFTWVFMPVSAALDIGEFGSMAQVNAMIASVLFDDALCSHYPEGAEVLRLFPGDFVTPPPPARLACLASKSKCLSNGVLIVHPATRSLSYATRDAPLHFPVRPTNALPWVEWESLSFGLPAPHRYQCCHCMVPIGGEAVVVRRPCTPPPNAHYVWGPGHGLPDHKTPLLTGRTGIDLLLCPHCWNSVKSPVCFTHHMAAIMMRTRTLLTQAQVCALCPGYEVLSALLEGVVAPVSGVRGAYTLSLHGADAKPGELVVLTGCALGAYPHLVIPEITALRLPVFVGLRIAEEEKAWA